AAATPPAPPAPEPVQAAAPPPPPPPTPEPAPVSPPAPAASTGSELDSILTKNAEDSVMSALTELTKKTAINRTGDGITVEDIVRDEVRPLLKQWLDKHLPSMVERLLQKELERVSKKVLGDD